MSIAPPNIEGDLTQFTTVVRLKNQSPGGTVELVMTPNPDSGPEIIVLSVVARLSEQLFTLSLPLKVGHWVSARQLIGPFRSSLSRPRRVLKAPTIPSTPRSHYTLYACAQCIAVEGFPGADITIKHGSSLYGPEKVRSDRLAHVRIGNKLVGGEQLELTASLPTGTAVGKTLPASQPPTISHLVLPPPSIPTLWEGQELVRVNNVLPGAKVELFLNGTLKPPARCSEHAAIVFETGVLERGHTWTASQHFDDCQLHSPPSPPVVVIGDPPGAPRLTDVCATVDAKHVTVEVRDLVPEARVQFHWIGTDGTDEFFSEVRATAEITRFTLHALGRGTLAVQQGLPNVAGAIRWSPYSSPPAKVRIVPLETATVISIRGPVYECGNAVRVGSFSPTEDAEVTVNSVLYGTIGKARFKYHPKINNGWVDVPVTPLTVGDTIYAYIEVCGFERRTETIVVQPNAIEQLMPPTPMGNFPASLRLVDVLDIVPGAIVELAQNTVLIAGSAVAYGANAATIEIPDHVKLTPGDKIQARQSLCGIVTAISTRHANITT